MNWRKWRVGLAIAIVCGALNAGAGLLGEMGWRSFVAVLCTSLLTNMLNFLKQHPVESINDNTTFRRREEVPNKINENTTQRINPATSGDAGSPGVQ